MIVYSMMPLARLQQQSRSEIYLSGKVLYLFLFSRLATMMKMIGSTMHLIGTLITVVRPSSRNFNEKAYNCNTFNYQRRTVWINK